MMGNEKSQPAGLKIDETTTEVTEKWSLHGATYAVGSVPKISVFINNFCSPSKVTPLEKFTKNLMIYRHPCILKYISSWRKGHKFHLATEQVQPLAQVLPSQTSLQICVGLQNILKALIFLHDSGAVSHNNVCRASIYVTQGGSWKLGGFEYLCRFVEMSSSYLEETRATRYELGIAPDEAKHLPQPLSAIDCYAFGVLALEVLDNKSSDGVPGMEDFLGLCHKSLQNKDSEARPVLSSLLSHPFFSHKFLSIHNFLVELAIKKENEKQDFFRSLTEDLSGFSEDIVASQLGSLLLSRIVLLDTTAQTFLLPSVFVPRSGSDVSCGTSLFSESTFQTHMVPRLLPLFCVRDVQIRLILLSHFPHYCHLFSQVQLQSRILPELLVGIKDTDDLLVSTTLRALADLVPLLGGATVIGGKRSKLFADGKPKVVKTKSKTSFQKEEYKTKDMHLYDEVEGIVLGVVLPERPSPDGGEYIPTSSDCGSEDEAWPDWECTKAGSETSTDLPNTSLEKLPDPPISPVNGTQNQHSPPTEHLQNDLKHLKVQPKPKSDDYEELFRDMEPVISLPQRVHVERVGQISNKFAPATEFSEEEGWHEDFGDWSATEEEVATNS